MYFTVLCDPHPLPLSLTGRGGWGVRADRRQTVKYLRTLSYRRSNAVKRPVILSEAKNPGRDPSLRSG